METLLNYLILLECVILTKPFRTGGIMLLQVVRLLLTIESTLPYEKHGNILKVCDKG